MKAGCFRKIPGTHAWNESVKTIIQELEQTRTQQWLSSSAKLSLGRIWGMINDTRQWVKQANFKNKTSDNRHTM